MVAGGCCVGFGWFLSAGEMGAENGDGDGDGWCRDGEVVVVVCGDSFVIGRGWDEGMYTRG